MTMLSENRERFLRAIAAAVPAERIAEIHFFQPMKQGGVESGVAVIAAEEPHVESPSQAPEAASDQAPQAPRFTVLTARYRLTLKGPDRGKWDANVVAEADAPLVTVDAVVRGVQRRSGDTEEPERMTGADVRAALERGSAQAQTNGQVA